MGEGNRSFRKVAIGFGLTTVANLVYLTSSLTVQQYSLKPGEICFVKALLQIGLFATAFVIPLAVRFFQPRSDKLEEKTNNVKFKLSKVTFIWVCLCGLSLAFVNLLANAGVKLMAVSDFIAFSQTSTVFTLFFSICLLRNKITWPEVCLCFTTIAGATMVAQPTFLFGKGNEIFGPTYMTGIAMAIPCAFLHGFANVLSAKIKGFDMSLFQVIAGMAAFVVALICPLVGLPNRFTMPPSNLPSSLAAEELGRAMELEASMPITTGVAIGSIIGSLLVIVACQQASPVLVTLVRCSELIWAMVADYIIFKVNPTPGVIHVSGSLLVMTSVAMMAFADAIQSWLCPPNVPGDEESARSIEVEGVEAESFQCLVLQKDEEDAC